MSEIRKSRIESRKSVSNQSSMTILGSLLSNHVNEERMEIRESRFVNEVQSHTSMTILNSQLSTLCSLHYSRISILYSRIIRR